MNAHELADYLINHGWEEVIINRWYEYVQEAMRDSEMPQADLDTILEAFELANDNPYIKSITERYGA